MIVWIIAVILLVSLAIIGYYQGAIRVAFSLLGLLIGASLAIPLGGVMAPILRMFGMHHPVLLSFVGPALAYLLILIAFKVGGMAVHRKLDTFYKYNASDTRRLLYERMIGRVGICLGLANATIYFFLICIVSYMIGYATVQLSQPGKESFTVKMVNSVARSVDATGMSKAIAPFLPKSPNYYNGADVLGDIVHTPLLQSRLSSYPPFLTLAERTEFESIAKDTKFQEFWQQGPGLGEFTSHELIKPLVSNVELYDEVMKLAGDDLPDLKAYLQTGVSPKYSEERILGRWKFDLQASMARALRAQPGMDSVSRRNLRTRYASQMGNAVLTATVDNRVILKAARGKREGGWKPTSTGKYEVTVENNQAEATIEGRRLMINLDKLPLAFGKS